MGIGGGHGATFHKSDVAELTAICDCDPEKLKWRLETYAEEIDAHPRGYLDFEEMLAGEQLDGVVIATPNYAHTPVALECLAAGVHTLIEKPLAVAVEEGEAVLRAAEEHGAMVAVGYSTRFRDAVVLMHDLLESRYFGRVQGFAYQFGTRGGWDPVSGYILERKTSGGGVLVATGSHFLDRMLYWFGWPDAFDYRDDSLGGPEANCVATFRFSSNGASSEGTVRLSKTTALPCGFVMATDRGTVILRDFPPDAPLTYRPKEAPSLELVVGRTSASARPRKTVFQQQLENFVDACRGVGKPMVTGREAVASLRLIEGLYACRKPMDPERDGS